MTGSSSLAETQEMKGRAPARIRVGKAAGIVGLSTLLSRILGFVRDAVIAYYFGATPAADAFLVAFRIPNLFRRLFAEGSLSVAIIPVLTETLHRQGREAAAGLARSIMALFFVVLIPVCIVGVLSAPLLVDVVAPGFHAGSVSYVIAVRLTRLVFPYLFFIGMTAACMGVLNSHGRFAAPALSPVVLNLSLIASALWLQYRFHPPVIALGVGVLVGGAGQLALQGPQTLDAMRGAGHRLRLFSPEIRRILWLMAPGAFGAAVYQINQVIGTILASLLPVGSIAFLYFADRLVQFPLGLIAISSATAALPQLSRLAVEKKDGEFKRVLVKTFHAVNFLMIPSMVGLIVLSGPIVVMLFERGKFGAVDTRQTASALICYATGLWAYAGSRIFTAGFQSTQDMRSPVIYASISVVINAVTGLVLMPFFGHNGLAFATAFAAMTNTIMLFFALRRRIGAMDGFSTIASAGRALAASIGMGAGLYVCLRYFPFPVSGRMLLKMVHLIFLIACGSAIYFILAVFLRCPELEYLKSMLNRRRAMK